MVQPGLNPKSGSGLGFGLRAGGLEAKEEESQISRSRREELDSGQLGAKPQVANVSVVDVERMEKEPQLRDQSSLPPPSKVARLSSDAAGVVTMVAPSPLVLGLGLGVGAGAGTGRSAFTFLQLQELEHQALIYKYMVAGVPVPLHLVLPIWKSVAAAASPSSAYAHYPTFMGCGSLCFNYWNSVEPEPGRCRRTDGKKWRCSRDVVPDQKYCERHMHRGRNRSRKPVEAGAAGPGNGSHGSGHGNGIPAASTAIATTAVQSNNDSSSINSTQLSISNPNGGLQLKPDATNSSSNSKNSNNVSPPRLGFSPTSVLQSSTVCKTGPS